jgi:hypothetical protein
LLNELFKAATTEALRELFTEEWHPYMKELPKKTIFRVTLTRDCSVADISPLDPALLATLRRYEQSKGYSFPDFNLPPRFALEKAVFEREYLLDKLQSNQQGKATGSFAKNFTEQAFKDYLNRFISEKLNYFCHVEAERKAQEKARECLHEIPKKLTERFSSVLNRCKNLDTLLERVQSCNIEDFREQVFIAALDKIKTYSDWKEYSAFMFGDNYEDDYAPSVPIYLDLADYDRTGRPIPHTDTIMWMNKALIATDGDESAESQSKKTGTKRRKNKQQQADLVVDAYGNNTDKLGDPMPEVKVGFMGNVRLRSLSDNSPCQERYGLIKSGSFPVGYASRKQMKLALETLSQKDWRGKTWDVMAYKKSDKKSKQKEVVIILFAYPDQMPDQVHFASVLTWEDDTATFEDRTFAGYAQQVIDILKKGTAKTLDAIEINVFALEKIDKERRKVAYYTRFTAKHFYEAALDWEKGCANIPEITIKGWGNKQGEIIMRRPHGIFPKTVVTAGNRVWQTGIQSKPKKVGGNNKTAGANAIKHNSVLDRVYSTDSKSLYIMAGLDLLIKDLDSSALSYMLKTVLNNGDTLLKAVGQAKATGQIVTGTADALTIPAILGLLMYKLGYKKEDYMKDTPYLIGSLLALADRLHYEYCKNVRTSEEDRQKKIVNTPPQLLGNAMLTIATQAPQRVVGLLGERMKPYLGWAETAYGDDCRYARSLLFHFRDVSEKIIQAGYIPQRLNDLQKSSLYLGYLANIRAKKAEPTNAEKVDSADEATKEIEGGSE